MRLIEMYNFSVDWFSNNIQIWSKLLEKFKDKWSLRFLEIGCFEGRATIWLLENILKNEADKIICIDTFKGSDEHKVRGQDFGDIYKTFIKNIEDHKEKVIILKGKSQDKLNLLEKEYFDFIYIDGSHNAYDVIEDAVISFKLLKKGGIIIFDDYRWKGFDDETKCPKLAIDCFLNIFRGKYKILHKEYQVAIEKI